MLTIQPWGCLQPCVLLLFCQGSSLLCFSGVKLVSLCCSIGCFGKILINATWSHLYLWNCLFNLGGGVLVCLISIQSLYFNLFCWAQLYSFVTLSAKALGRCWRRVAPVLAASLPLAQYGHRVCSSAIRLVLAQHRNERESNWNIHTGLWLFCANICVTSVNPDSSAISLRLLLFLVFLSPKKVDLCSDTPFIRGLTQPKVFLCTFWCLRHGCPSQTVLSPDPCRLFISNLSGY